MHTVPLRWARMMFPYCCKPDPSAMITTWASGKWSPLWQVCLYQSWTFRIAMIDVDHPADLYAIQKTQQDLPSELTTNHAMMASFLCMLRMCLPAVTAGRR